MNVNVNCESLRDHKFLSLLFFGVKVDIEIRYESIPATIV